MGIAYCFYQLGNYKKAFKAIDRALQLDPACEEALAMKASLLRSSPHLSPQDRVVASLQVIKQLYAVNPKHPEALNYIADHEQAIRDLTNADVQALAKKILADGNLVKVVMHPSK